MNKAKEEKHTKSLSRYCNNFIHHLCKLFSVLSCTLLTYSRYIPPQSEMDGYWEVEIVGHVRASEIGKWSELRCGGH